VNTIRIRLGHESLDVTLAYLKGKDAESEEAKEHANSSSLARIGLLNSKESPREISCRQRRDLPFSSLDR
jgi:hypothetical protein